MAQIGEKVGHLTNESYEELSKQLPMATLRYFRNMIAHDYESVNKAFLLPHIKQVESDRAKAAVIARLNECQAICSSKTNNIQRNDTGEGNIE